MDKVEFSILPRFLTKLTLSKLYPLFHLILSGFNLDKIALKTGINANKTGINGHGMDRPKYRVRKVTTL